MKQIAWFLCLGYVLIMGPDLTAQNTEGTGLEAPYPPRIQQAQAAAPLITDLQDGLPSAYPNYLTPIAPLDTLIERALSVNPEFRNADIIRQQQDLKVSLEKRKWLKAVAIQGVSSYGTGSALSATDDGTVVTNQLTNNVSLLYNAGISIKFDPYYWATRRKEIQLLQSQSAVAANDQYALESKIREEVIARYQTYRENLALLRLNADALEASLVSFETAKNYFSNGTITITEYNGALTTRVGAEAAFEKAKIALQLSYLLLKEITGGKVD
ncbi:MAG: TolC family protein [Bacteroidota bacterium]